MCIYLTKQVLFFLFCSFFIQFVFYLSFRIQFAHCSILEAIFEASTTTKKNKRKEISVCIKSILPGIRNSCQKKKKAKNVNMLPSTIALLREFFFFFPFSEREISFFFFSFISLFLFIIILYTERLNVLLYRK